MEALKKKRSVHFQGLQRIRTQVNPILEESHASFESMVKLESFFNKLKVDAEKFYEATDDVLVKLVKDDDETEIALTEQCFSEKDTIIDLVVNVESKIAWLKSTLEKSQSNDSIISNTPLSTNSGIRYATIMKDVEPPTFDGDATEFAEWRAMFENLVHDNQDYTPTTKLYFLKKCFVGEAKGVVSHYPLTREGYANAWAYVIYRYSKPKAVVGAFFKKLMALEKIKNELGIQRLLDSTNSVIRGLTSAKENVNDTMSRFITYLTYIKLDDDTRRDWDNHYTNLNQYPKFEEIDEFLQNRAHIASERVYSKKENQNRPKENSGKKSFVATNNNGKKPTCVDCNGDHALYTCENFKKKDPKERYKFVKSKSLCVLCLHSGHNWQSCTHTNFKCKCGDPHNYLLHFGNKKPDPKPDENATSGDTSKETPIQKTSLSVAVENIEKTVLLPSAVVKIICGDIVGKMRVLLDSCSQATLISDAAIKKFNLPTRKSAYTSSITGVGPSSTTTSSIVDLIVASKKDTFRLVVQADIVPASAMKYSINVEFPKKLINSLRNIPLADPAYHDTNISIDKIDMIIGAEYFGKCMMDESLTLDSLDLRLSQFGWIVSGVVPQNSDSKKFVGFTRQDIDEKLTKFWEIEEASIPVKIKNFEADQCVRHFENKYSFAEDGKFIVRLPFKIPRDSVENNRKRAMSALLRVEKNLNEENKSAYCEFMREYRELGHMSIAKYDPSACFLPHRAVIRACSSTTPLRVVFNASAGNPSLNDALMNGPNIQRELFDILVSMRSFKFVFTADIAKMYRAIWMHLEDRKYQSIFWRESPNHKIEENILNTVTYGTGPAAFTAT
ncbi:uncharacterized protein LOC135834183 [Planococcus citri]|uniref:uncharacterized protein LOC135834183 n=1 Tax=Planococcus citri TaxID=170843 RepID=UPI0031F72426